ncbi:single-stranded DNA-binding protein [Candidatus Endomicrobiellum devescovinae]|jgi:single-strand DNA-binding protein|uniref:single-stranded DNA-binding protein n=1 Tax=Candidatus Endomicrobiellum devescovinae TaxID=3242322 RepID=UPI0028203E70|nr:single-stranded DNA-binding protein [Endomicrobium sp.]MDR1433787.1 single-stranded DNA-binding protein [Endomicrobium sp.]
MTQQNNIRLPEQNSVIMVGRLTRDPELRRTGTGKAVCSFDIAISRRIKDSVTGEWKDADPTFVPVIVWGEQAERCGERLKKGSPVHVEGRLQTNKWEGTDGTKRSRLEAVASRVQILSVARQDNAAIGAKPADSINASSDQYDGIGGDGDEDIPF